MTEDEAKDALIAMHSLSAVQRLQQYVSLLMSSSSEQNLIAPSTMSSIWSRHILDSAQLEQMAPAGRWADVGSGAGLPGIVIALVSDRPVTLIEPRRLRVAFLQACVEALGIAERVTVAPVKAQNAAGIFEAVSARAVATIDAVLSSTAHLASRSTTYILPKGKSAESEVAVARRSWHGVFHVKQSIVDPVSGIVIASQVRRR